MNRYGVGMGGRIRRLERPDRTLGILNAIVFGVTVVGGILAVIAGHLPALAVVGAVVVGFVLVVLYIWVDRSRGQFIYTFDENSPEMVKFFADWYAGAGDYWIFCDDLDWMDGSDAASIRATLIEHAENVTIALREQRGAAFDELKRNGVGFCEVPATLSTRAKFSIHRHDGNRRMIIRLKNKDPDWRRRIAFRATSDEFFIDMAMDLINNNCPPTP